MICKRKKGEGQKITETSIKKEYLHYFCFNLHSFLIYLYMYMIMEVNIFTF